jgi:hemoglobin
MKNSIHASTKATAALLCVLAVALASCGTGKQKQENKGGFFTSGSSEADQRASQRMAKSEQLAGSGEGAGEKEKAKTADEPAKGASDRAPGEGNPLQAEGKQSLFERLGGEQGLTQLVDDFTTRLLEDPRVNWSRKGLDQGGFRLFRGKPATWNESPQTVAMLKKHMVQFLALATGGPARYEGKNMRSAHANMHITNSEFDAAVGDIKATLDKQQIPNREQKELLAIIESTRPQIVSER